MINPNWATWLHRSIMVHLEADVRTENLAYELLLQSAPPDPVQRYPKIELRIDGPYYTPLVNNEWRCKVEINVLLSTQVHEADLNAATKLRGVIENSLSKSIQVYSYGETSPQQLGVLKLERVVATNLGRISLDNLIEQSIVEVPGYIELAGV